MSIEKARHTILLGGIGGDSHSVGLAILRLALTADGYRVNSLGTQNTLEDFFQWAGFCNVVMISSMDGHARYYLRRFADLKQRYKVTGPLWYLGGNLDIGNGIGYERKFRELGFDQVFVKFVDITTVLEVLRKDLDGVEPVPECTALWEQSYNLASNSSASVSDELLEANEFKRARRFVLEQWSTASQARDLEGNAMFLSSQPSFVQAQSMVRAG